MNSYAYLICIPLLPLAVFVLLGILGRRFFKTFSGAIGTLSMFITTTLSIYAAYQYFFVSGKTEGVYQKIVTLKYVWLQLSPNISIDMGFLLDPISVMMIVVVSFVSLMVHLFSLGYMKGEERFATYFSFLSLFTFSMLGLVLSSNIFQIYIFWELVGVSSYLLIGFYFEKPSAVAASKKAFIITRFADLGFLVGILMLAFYSNSLNFVPLISKLTSAQSPEFLAITSASFMGASMLTWALVLVFIGGAGKSAMFPLHVWLPDAMEGPTPVSALIHAATMVVAGVFLVARLFPVFCFDPSALQVVTYTGVFSALIAAVIACVQTDVKRILAFSTMSQIGFMMFSLGVSRYGGELGLGFTASMFHLFTHAFFKSLLFLCAGAIIHQAHSNNMNDMGGLRKAMPITHFSFLIACLAISGIPPFSGFFSKEDILTAAYHTDKGVYVVAVFTSTLTAFYMFRLYFSVFWNKPIPSSLPAHEEATPTMKIPMIILAVCSLFAGFVPISSWISSDGRPLDTRIDPGFIILPVLLATGGIMLAGYLYKSQNERPGKIVSALGSFYKLVYHKFYIDEIYLFITKKIIFNLVARPAAWIDKHIVDGFMNLLAFVTEKISYGIRGLQSGKLQNYALYFFCGIIGLAVLFIYITHTQ
jgi:NADH-quinone oxidoreductase subunit L